MNYLKSNTIVAQIVLAIFYENFLITSRTPPAQYPHSRLLSNVARQIMKPFFKHKSPKFMGSKGDDFKFQS